MVWPIQSIMAAMVWSIAKEGKSPPATSARSKAVTLRPDAVAVSFIFPALLATYSKLLVPPPYVARIGITLPSAATKERSPATKLLTVGTGCSVEVRD